MHTHVESAIAGYSNNDEPPRPYNDILEVAGAVQEMLIEFSVSEHERATMHAENEDYETAWNTRELSDALEVCARNLDSSRGQAPLYKDNPELFEQTLSKLVEDAAGMPLTNDGSTVLLVWECDESECAEQGD